eukprot:jgi/Botrbrau1/9218/Bobra.0028s0014.1
MTAFALNGIVALWLVAATRVKAAEISVRLDPIVEAKLSLNSTQPLPFQNTTIRIPLTLGVQPSYNANIQKRGVSWGFDDSHIAADLRALAPGVSWWYSWGASGSKYAEQDLKTSKDLGLEFVPMQWANWGIENLPKDLETASEFTPVTTLLGFNEPNHREQANLTPRQAAELWPQLVKVAKERGLKLGSPSAATCGANCITNSPFDWMDQWIQECYNLYPWQGCPFDFTTTHFYSCNVEYLNRFLQEYHSRYGKPVWLTEFACPLGSSTDVNRQAAFMRDALNLMDSQYFTERYNWFIARCDPNDGWLGPTICLLNPSSETPELNLLGKLYTNKLSNADVRGLQNLKHYSYALPLEDDFKTWSGLCGNCTSSSAAAIKALSRGARAAAISHCRSCGYASIEGVYQKQDVAGPSPLAPRPSLQIQVPTYGSPGEAPIPG